MRLSDYWNLRALGSSIISRPACGLKLLGALGWSPGIVIARPRRLDWAATVINKTHRDRRVLSTWAVLKDVCQRRLGDAGVAGSHPATAVGPSRIQATVVSTVDGGKPSHGGPVNCWRPSSVMHLGGIVRRYTIITTSVFWQFRLKCTGLRCFDKRFTVTDDK